MKFLNQWGVDKLVMGGVVGGVGMAGVGSEVAGGVRP